MEQYCSKWSNLCVLLLSSIVIVDIIATYARRLAHSLAPRWRSASACTWHPLLEVWLPFPLLWTFRRWAMTLQTCTQHTLLYSPSGVLTFYSWYTPEDRTELTLQRYTHFHTNFNERRRTPLPPSLPLSCFSKTFLNFMIFSSHLETSHFSYQGSGKENLLYSQMMPNEQLIHFEGNFFMVSTLSFRNF